MPSPILDASDGSRSFMARRFAAQADQKPADRAQRHDPVSLFEHRTTGLAAERDVGAGAIGRPAANLNSAPAHRNDAGAIGRSAVIDTTGRPARRGPAPG